MVDDGWLQSKTGSNSKLIVWCSKRLRLKAGVVEKNTHESGSGETRRDALMGRIHSRVNCPH